jgi:perosamine synthetase
MIGVGTFTATDRMRELVKQVLDSGRLSYGDMCRKFEHDFAALHDSRYGVLSNSGTSSLQVAVQALKEEYGWQDGDEVIVPAVTFVASVNVILHNNLKPVLVDVDPIYYELDADRIERALTDRTRAVMPVHVFGQSCDMTSIRDIADSHDLMIIEDSCECMFVKHNGVAAGAWGDVGCFSTYVAHLLTTGVGGLGITNDPDIAAKMRSLVNHGRDGIYFDKDADHSEVIAKRFSFDSIGHSYRITELEAALGLAQLEGWREMIAKRQMNAQYLATNLWQYRDYIQLPAVRPETEHAWMMFPIVLRDEPKQAICEELEANGIETREMLPLTRQPCYEEMWNADRYPVADWINRCGFYVGCHQDLNENDLTQIVDSIGKYFRGHSESSSRTKL